MAEKLTKTVLKDELWTFNLIHGDDGRWYHECMGCENVMVTDEKIIETKEEK